MELSNSGQGPVIPLPAGSTRRSHGIYDGKLVVRYPTLQYGKLSEKDTMHSMFENDMARLAGPA